MRTVPRRNSTCGGLVFLLCSVSLCSALLGCASDRTSGRVLIRSGGIVTLQDGNVGETILVENEGPGRVMVRDVGRRSSDFRLYAGQAKEYRGPMDLLIATEGGKDAMILYRAR